MTARMQADNDSGEKQAAFLERIDPTDTEFQHQLADHVARYDFASRFCLDRSVVDVACGNGYGTKYLAGFATDCLGVDIDAEAVELATSLYAGEGCSFRCDDCRSIGSYGRKFDVAVSFETVEHIEAQAQKEFIDAVAEALTPGGTLIASTPNRLIWENRNPFHVNELTPDGFRALLSTRFSRVELFGQRLSPYSTEHTLHHRRVANLSRTIRAFPTALMSKLLPFAVARPPHRNSDRLAVEVAPWHYTFYNFEDISSADVIIAVCRKARV